MSDDLTFDDVAQILATIDSKDNVLVGGQAINFWAERYRDRNDVANQIGELPLTSKDIDFYSADPKALAKYLANQMPESEAKSAETGAYLVYVNRGTRQLDIINDVPGIKKSADIKKLAMEVPPNTLLNHSLRVLHPIHCVKSRVYNYYKFGRTDAHSMRQLSLSVLCAREYLVELLSQDSMFEQTVRAWNENIFTFCVEDVHGKTIYNDSRVDPFALTILDDPRLNESFREKRVPRMLEQLRTVRERVTLASERAKQAKFAK